MTTRREFVLSGSAAIIAGGFSMSIFGQKADAKSGQGETYEVAHSESEWKQMLTPEQYRVLRDHGTERAGTSPLDREKRAGKFACAGCGQELFASDAKFDQARDGRASSHPCQRPWAHRSINRGSPPAPKCIAAAVAGISAMYSRTGRAQPDCGIA